MTFPNLTLTGNMQTCFANAGPYWDKAIQPVLKSYITTFRPLIKRNTFELGQGIEKNYYLFHPGRGDQRGLQTWSKIQQSVLATDTDPGYDSAVYNPYRVEYGISQGGYSGVRTERMSDWLNVKDVRFDWQFQEWLKLGSSFFGFVTADVWENLASESYNNFIFSNNKGYVLTEGFFNSTSYTYNPDYIDADGDNVLTFKTGTKVSTLDWSYLNDIYLYLSLQAPMGAIGHAGGTPKYALVVDPADFRKMIDTNDKLRYSYDQANPQLVIDNFATVRDFRDWALLFNRISYRFSVKSITATTTTLKRVDPFIKSAAGTKGYKWDVNPDYCKAQYSLCIPFLENVFTFEIPVAGPSSPGGGTSFGTVPSYNGEFRWIQPGVGGIDNLLGEKGLFFSRFEAFRKPGICNAEATGLLYRRDTTPEAKLEVSLSTAASSSDAVDITVDVASTDVDSTNRIIVVTLEKPLGCVTSAPITLYADGGGTITGTVADSSSAPTYKLSLVSAPTYSDYTAAGGAYVKCT